jgi:hypothetical protein|tara:strand:+ start:199 stop:762 length:564 start_codon:yes stop_codon:yes gene_type:complete
MNKQILVIYHFNSLYKILFELQNFYNFSLIKIDKIKDLEIYQKKNNNFLLISNKKVKDISNQIEINNFPIEITKLIENINIKFLKKKYTQQADIMIGNYKLDLNSRKISNKFCHLNLTEREASILIFLNNSKKPVKISKMQTEVWGHNSKLETHTVETHIYRLRKKIKDVFGDNNLIKSSKLGYSFY